MINQRGDTIIEVMLAFSVFCLVSLGAITIMNQGTNAAQRALEITLVRQQVDAQAESIRAAQLAASRGNATEWSAITADKSKTTVLDTTNGCPDYNAIKSSGAFVMDARTATRLPSDAIKSFTSSTLPFAQVDYPTDGSTPSAYGIWVERDRAIGLGGPGAKLPDTYSFTIKACWAGVGLKAPMTISTVVRLYDPGT